MGGRLLPAGDEPAAMLMYDDDRGTRLTLYSRAGPSGGRGVFRYARADDVAAFSWIDAGMSYVVTARTDEARLLRVAQRPRFHLQNTFHLVRVGHDQPLSADPSLRASKRQGRRLKREKGAILSSSTLSVSRVAGQR